MSKFQGKWNPQEHSTTQAFIQECVKMTNDETVFSTFKTNPIFIPIIGNDVALIETAKKWVVELKNSPLLTKLNTFKTNDLYGGAPTYDFPIVGKCSTGVIYFMRVIQEIMKHTGDISNFNVCEIGSGYGGQAKIILDWGVKSYTCIDLPEVLGLCKKYLGLYKYNNVDFYDTENIPEKSFDLVISNWCLSEMNNDAIEFYLDTIIKHSRYGFFLMNLWDQDRRAQVTDLFVNKNLYLITYGDRMSKHLFPDNWVLISKKEKI